MKNKNKAYLSHVALTLGLGFGLIGQSIAMDLVVATDEINRSVLQTAVGIASNNQWNVTAYEGTDLAMVDDIRQRAVSSQLPNAAQIPGATIRRWAALGFINELDTTAVVDGWKHQLPEVIQDDVSFQDKMFAIPTQIHRSNWMWMNSEALVENESSAVPPRTWKSFFELAASQKNSNKPFLLTVDDPSQNTLILEALILGLKGPEFYQKTFQEFDYKALKGVEMIDVYTQLAKLRPLMNGPAFPDWETASQALADGKGSLLFAGDWIKPYFIDVDGNMPDNILCEPLPDASATFLYNLNSVVLFKDTNAAESQKLAKLLFTEAMLTDLNLREGSIPARLDISPWGFDRCGVRAMREFRSAHTINTLLPSLAAGMAASEVVQKSVYKAVNEFITNSTMSPEQGARNLAKSIRVAIYKI